MLKGLVGFVTGGATGLGRATVERFVREGASVVICDLPKSEGQKLAKSLGKNAIFAPCNVSSEENVHDALKLCMKTFYKLNVVVNCARIGLIKSTYFHQESVKNEVHPLDDFIKVQQVNLNGTFNTLRLSATHLCSNNPDEDGQRGVIINTASVLAFDGISGHVAHSASDAAIVGITLPVARDLAQYGIRVVTIAPGLFPGPFMDSLPEKTRAFFADYHVFPKRFGHPDEFAQLVETIILNKMLNGETIRLDGSIRL